MSVALVLAGCGGGVGLSPTMQPATEKPPSTWSALEGTAPIQKPGETAPARSIGAPADTTTFTTDPSDVSSTSTSQTSSTTPGTTDGLALISLGADVAGAFEQAAEAMAPIAVFAPEVLPAGSALAPAWWPVFDALVPPAGGTVDNPRIQGEGQEPQAQVVVDTPSGVLLFVENFRGDLGDVSGRPVTQVGESTVTAYQMPGGTLLQWSHDGRWYGIFGRGEPDGVLISIASRMDQLLR